MSYRTVSDVLSLAQSFHQRVAKLLQEQFPREPRAGHLADYLGAHQDYLAKVLEEAHSFANHAVLDTWLQFVPDTELELPDWLESDVQEMSLEELSERVLEAEEEWFRLYRTALGASSTERVRHLFQRLLELENHERRRIARAAIESEDV